MASAGPRAHPRALQTRVDPALPRRELSCDPGNTCSQPLRWAAGGRGEEGERTGGWGARVCGEIPLWVCTLVVAAPAHVTLRTF